MVEFFLAFGDKVAGTLRSTRPPPAFDPRIEPVVRVRMRHLRSKLNRVYASGDCTWPIRIRLEPGSYVPIFEAIESPADVQPASCPREPSEEGQVSTVRRGWLRPMYSISAAAGLILIVAFGFHRSRTEYAGERPQTSAEALKLYQIGHDYVARRDFLELPRAIEYLDASISQDPGFGPAYSDLARCYLLQALYGFRTTPILAKANAAAATAVQLAPPVRRCSH